MKTCVECLHCKVSAKSTENDRLCFCAVRNKDEQHEEAYWLAKPVCENFEGFSE